MVARAQRGGNGAPSLYRSNICSTATVSVWRSRRAAAASRPVGESRSGQKSSRKRQLGDRVGVRGGVVVTIRGILLGVAHTPPGRPSRPAPKRQQPPPIWQVASQPCRGDGCWQFSPKTCIECPSPISCTTQGTGFNGPADVMYIVGSCRLTEK